MWYGTTSLNGRIGVGPGRGGSSTGEALPNGEKGGVEGADGVTFEKSVTGGKNVRGSRCPQVSKRGEGLRGQGLKGESTRIKGDLEGWTGRQFG